MPTVTHPRTAHGTQVPWVTLAGLALIIVVFLSGQAMFETLVFNRHAILHGELWRIVTGHIVHLDATHLLANAAAFAALGAACELSVADGRAALLTALAVPAVVIGVALLLFMPTIGHYGGLSAVLNTVFVVLCFEQFRRSRSWVWPALLAGGALKIAWEATFGPLATSSLDWPPSVGAHLFGFFTGIVLEFVNQFRRMRRSWYFPWAACPFIP